MNDRKTTSANPVFRPMFLAALIALGTLGSVACKSADEKAEATPYNPGRVDLSNDLTVKATVVAVDAAKRTVTLLREDGHMLTVECGPSVRNFDQIAKGDTLRVKYKESMSASLKTAEEGASPVQAAAVASRAAPGEAPAAGVGMAVTARVKVESVDKTSHIVVFSMSSGELRTVRAARPEGREFVNHLKVGDIVQIDYTASVALTVDKL